MLQPAQPREVPLWLSLSLTPDAARCGMNQSSLYEMKHSIVQVVSDYVELEGEDLVEVNVTMDEAMGTIYSVAMPVTRVKPQVQACFVALPVTCNKPQGTASRPGEGEGLEIWSFQVRSMSWLGRSPASSLRCRHAAVSSGLGR